MRNAERMIHWCGRVALALGRLRGRTGGKEKAAAAAAAAGTGSRAGGSGRVGGTGTEERGGAGISASSISLFDVRPAPNSAVRATLSKWLSRLQRKCLGTTRHHPVLLHLPTKPYRYSVLYRHSQLTFFPERLSFRLSDVCSERRNAPREKNPRLTSLDQENPKTFANYFSIGL